MLGGYQGMACAPSWRRVKFRLITLNCISIAGRFRDSMAPKTIEHTTVAYLDNEDRADISNPIHSTEVAKAYGFGGPLVGGVTVWGWATDTILEALGDDWLWDGWAEYSFRQPTFPGDTLVIKADADGGQGSKSWTIRMVNQSGELCVLGKVGLGRADWSHEFVRPRTMTPVIELPVKGELTLGNARPGTDWAAAQMDLTGDVMKEFVSQKQRTANPLFTGDRAIAHPSWTAGWAEKLLRHNFDIPSSMHTRSRVEGRTASPVGRRSRRSISLLPH